MPLIKVMRGTLSTKCINYLKINAGAYRDFIPLHRIVKAKKPIEMYIALNAYISSTRIQAIIP